MNRAWVRRKIAGGTLVLLYLVSSSICGQPAPKRLSQWLLEQPNSANSYEVGLSWRVPEETVPQTALFLDLMGALSRAETKVNLDRAELDHCLRVSWDASAISILR